MVVVADGLLLLVVVVVVVGGTVENVEDVEGAVVVFPILVVTGLGMVVDDGVGLDESVVVVMLELDEVPPVVVVASQC